MPGKTKNLKHLNHLLKIAHQPNKHKIMEVIDRYKAGDINNYRTAENAVAALAFPSASTPKRVTDLYQKAMGAVVPASLHKKLQQNYTLKMLLFTDVGKGSKDNEKNELTEEERERNTRSS